MLRDKTPYNDIFLIEDNRHPLRAVLMIVNARDKGIPEADRKAQNGERPLIARVLDDVCVKIIIIGVAEKVKLILGATEEELLAGVEQSL